MIIREPRPDSNFYILDKRISEDERLSWAARGMLIFLLGKPDHWRVSIEALINCTAGAGQRQSGKTAVYAIINELLNVGYLRRKKHADGTLDYLVRERATPSDPNSGNPDLGNPDQGNPDLGNQPLVSTDSKKELRKAAKTEKVAARPSLPEWLDPELWAEWEQHRREKKKPMTPSSALKTIEQLAAYRAQGVDLKAAINHSIANGYQGIFPPNSKTSGVSSSKTKPLAEMDYSESFF
jgi:hypothetical protein